MKKKDQKTVSFVVTGPPSTTIAEIKSSIRKDLERRLGTSELAQELIEQLVRNMKITVIDESTQTLGSRK